VRLYRQHCQEQDKPRTVLRFPNESHCPLIMHAKNICDSLHISNHLFIGVRGHQ
jgi:hypothetical protein